MTSPLLRKRRTTVRGSSVPATTTCKLVAVGVMLALAGSVSAQGYAPGQPTGYQPTPYGPRIVQPSYSPSPHGQAKPIPYSASPGRVTPAADRLRRTALQQPRLQPRRNGRDTGDIQIQLEPPGREQVFGQIESEAGLFERMRQQARDRRPTDRLVFPDQPVLSQDQYVGRAWPRRHLVVEPNFAVYDRLYFQQLNFERYGWDLGIIQPALSTAIFFKDLAFLPYNFGTDPCRHFDSNAGYCLPGDPVPLLLYPPRRSASGSAAEIAALAALFAIFP